VAEISAKGLPLLPIGWLVWAPSGRNIAAVHFRQAMTMGNGIDLKRLCPDRPYPGPEQQQESLTYFLF
jgi:hypothetical protein